VYKNLSYVKKDTVPDANLEKLYANNAVRGKVSVSVKQNDMGRNILRNRSLYICVSCGLGSIAPDIGHALNLLTKGQISWNFGHSIIFWVWFTTAFLAGLVATVYLGRIKCICRKI
jgi:Na+/H+ antiporter NhaB